ncbi:hypothetical protein VHEMI08445 [[Torrubiella] hemipterigena]|uniref:N-acetyltransferase domain-containing protein n=1 Tax=[Torrubiella] hemipterigena TaxID=1531966 RepID=A0A0A1TN77_9HYPO|nr:hypothetical protein VHEMI08445 [[Torrubiella] hemipterigena]
MVLVLLDATEADATRFADIEHAAITPDAVNKTLFPGPFPKEGLSRAEVLTQYLRCDPACKWVKVVDTELEAKGEQATIAFSVWYFWESGGGTLPYPTWGTGTNPEACELYFGGLQKKWQETFGGRPHAYLKFMHTTPSHRGRGAGSMMLAWGLSQADEKSLETYLQSSHEGRRLYEKLGFEQVETYVVDLSNWGGPPEDEVPIMIRPLQRSVSSSLANQ